MIFFNSNNLYEWRKLETNVNPYCSTWLLVVFLLLDFPFLIMILFLEGVFRSFQPVTSWHSYIRQFLEVPSAMVYTSTVQQKVKFHSAYVIRQFSSISGLNFYMKFDLVLQMDHR